jgi:hypothetical protein
MAIWVFFIDTAYSDYKYVVVLLSTLLYEYNLTN